DIWVALIGFHFQIYCDFSAYTDIALGSACLLGYSLPENFDRPYLAKSPGEYWRRWHKTLSRFAFDYVYKPLGGGRQGLATTIRNTFIVFIVIGFWHGAAWKYVLFGAYHAWGVIGSKVLTHWNVSRIAPSWVKILATNLFIV